jgi:hypothetical protein
LELRELRKPLREAHKEAKEKWCNENIGKQLNRSAVKKIA